jgi:hypothetical protein
MGSLAFHLSTIADAVIKHLATIIRKAFPYYCEKVANTFLLTLLTK